MTYVKLYLKLLNTTYQPICHTFCANSRAQTDLDTDGFVKILTEGTDGILGKLSVIHHHLVYYVDASCIFISGADASEMVTECTCH